MVTVNTFFEIALNNIATHLQSLLPVVMKALKCKTLGASVMYIHCTLANIHVHV